uniref:Uncharacterized protein n=1 Tax=Ornithorhynchus anatinus TaxID=9258 RepID=F7EL71_ORNAN
DHKESVFYSHRPGHPSTWGGRNQQASTRERTLLPVHPLRAPWDPGRRRSPGPGQESYRTPGQGPYAAGPGRFEELQLGQGEPHSQGPPRPAAEARGHSRSGGRPREDYVPTHPLLPHPGLEDPLPESPDPAHLPPSSGHGAAFKEHSLPLDRQALEVWRALGANAHLASHVLGTLTSRILERLAAGVSDRAAWDRHSLESIAATNVVYELLFAWEYSGAVTQFFPRLFLALITQVHYVLELGLRVDREEEVGEPTVSSTLGPWRTSLEALKGLLSSQDCWKTFTSLELQDGWDLFACLETFQEGVVLLARTMVQNRCPVVGDLLTAVATSLPGMGRQGRSIAVGLLGEVSAGAMGPAETVPGRERGRRSQEWTVEPRTPGDTVGRGWERAGFGGEEGGAGKSRSLASALPLRTALPLPHPISLHPLSGILVPLRRGARLPP